MTGCWPMMIGPPPLKARAAHVTDAACLERGMTDVHRRGYPVHAHGAWQGGSYICQTAAGGAAERVRAIAEAFIVSLRTRVARRDLAPQNLNADKPNLIWDESDNTYGYDKDELQEKCRIP
ncbi:Integrase [Edwardsiella anguillarum]|nr:hypothetical protein QY76_10080 [Edwardsiella sp. EA181011]RFT01766.1 hypothetical protein CGL57_15170 [Edwardsiella anguillarum]BET84494.1 Integrase [Edwardsiella anguillarum]BET87860.1 Integrase [Edwardsiella anguillarum]